MVQSKIPLGPLFLKRRESKHCGILSCRKRCVETTLSLYQSSLWQNRTAHFGSRPGGSFRVGRKKCLDHRYPVRL